MKFLIDHQLPVQLAIHLRKCGHECDHVHDLGLGASDDLTIWNHAQQTGSVLISKDEDFVYLAARPGDSGKLVWVRLGNCRNAALLGAFDKVLVEIVATLTSGQRLVELR